MNNTLPLSLVLIVSFSKDNYLDAYLRIITPTSPLQTALVFSCGMGAVRTTFAMVAACIVRRKQLINMGMADPYAVKPIGSNLIPISNSNSGSGVNTVCSEVLCLFYRTLRLSLRGLFIADE